MTSYKDYKIWGKDESRGPCLANPTPKSLSMTPTPSHGQLRGSWGVTYSKWRQERTQNPWRAAGDWEYLPHLEEPPYSVGISGDGERPSGDQRLEGNMASVFTAHLAPASLLGTWAWIYLLGTLMAMWVLSLRFAPSGPLSAERAPGLSPTSLHCQALFGFYFCCCGSVLLWHFSFLFFIIFFPFF